jgi:signal transduction histidine kinase/Tfp pilus assembly protein FimT
MNFQNVIHHSVRFAASFVRGLRVVSICIGAVVVSVVVVSTLVVFPVHSQTKKVDSLRNTLQNTLQNMRSSARGLDTATVSVLSDLAWSYGSTDANKALHHAREAVALARRLDNVEKLAEALNTLGNIYRFQAQYDSAFKAIDEARLLSERANIKKQRAISSGSLGLLYQERGMYIRALDYHTQALSLREEMNDKKGIGYSYRNLSALYRLQRDYRTALDYALKSMRIRREMNDLPALAYIMGDIGTLYQEQGQNDSARTYQEASLRLATTLHDKQGQASALNNLGVVLFHENKPQEAIPLHLNALTLFNDLRDGNALAATYAHLAAAFLASRNFPDATRYAAQGLRFADSLNVRPHKQRLYRIHADIFHAQNNDAKAFVFERYYSTLKDSMLNDEALRSIAGARSLYQDERKNRQIVALQGEQERQKLVRNILFIGLVLVFGVALWLTRLYRQKKSANDEILRQQHILEEQAAEIEVTNTALHEQNQELRSLSEEKTELMGIVSHDLKNPIGAVLSFATMLTDTSLALSNEQRTTMITHIGETSERMLEMVRNLLDTQRIESEQFEVTLSAIYLSPILSLLVENFTSRAQAKDITLHYNAHEDDAMVIADEQLLFQALENIISNAVKYSPYGKNVFINVTECIPLPGNRPVVRTTVRDEGPGMTPDDMTKLFGKFTRLSARPTAGEHSTGLGLNIVKKLVEMMHGSVWCESEHGKGATFVVELPLANVNGVENASAEARNSLHV